MSGYPNHPPGYGYGYSYGAPPSSGPPPSSAQSYGAPPSSAQTYGAPPSSAQTYGAPPSSAQTYGAPPSSAQTYGAPPTSQNYSAHPYGAPPPSHGQSSPYDQYASPYSSGHNKPPKDHSQPYSGGGGGYQPSSAPSYGSPFASAFPPGTDPNVVACFQLADQDGSGLIDDKEMQRALSSYSQSFSLRTVHLLMIHFTTTNTRKMGPKEFTSLFYSLQNWRAIFERFDKDRSGKIDSSELRDALLSMGFAVSPVILDLLVSKFDKTGGKSKAVEYDNFIECCLTVKGLTEKFKERDTTYCGSATFTYESFMLTVLPFLIA